MKLYSSYCICEIQKKTFLRGGFFVARKVDLGCSTRMSRPSADRIWFFDLFEVGGSPGWILAGLIFSWKGWSNSYIMNAIYFLYLKTMWIQITKEKTGYSAYISEYRIHTQWDTFEDLLQNLQEAVDLYFSKEEKDIPSSLIKLINYKPSHTFNMVIS